MKRALPTLQRRPGRRAERTVAPRERADAPQPLITIGYANQTREASQFAVQLCAALVERGVKVAALLAGTGDEPIVDARLGAFLEAGARAAKSVHVPPQGGQAVLQGALEQLAGEGVVLALGNVVARFYRPFFSIVVTGHRRQLISDDAQVLRADLEITSPSEHLAEELAKLLQARLG